MEREAAVKLTVDDGQYAATMRRTGDLTSKAIAKGTQALDFFGRKLDQGQAALQTFSRNGVGAFERVGAAARRQLAGGVSAGVKQAKRDIEGLNGVASKAIGLVTGIAAGFSAGAALEGAIALDAQLKTLAYRLQIATGEQVKATDLQVQFQRAAAVTGRRTGEMALAFDKVFSATKNLDFANATLETIGTTATATSESVETVATITQQLQRKFGLAAGEIGDALAQIYEGAQQGGPAFQDFANVMDVLGADLLQAGIKGKRGLGFLIGALNMADAESGGLAKQVSGLQALFTKLGSANTLKSMGKMAGIDPRKLINEKDAIQRLRIFLDKGQKGLDALRATFIGPEEAKALRILFLDPFEKALADAHSQGLKGGAANKAASAALDQLLADFGKGTQTAANMQAQAIERMQDPQARLQQAMEAMEAAFVQPELIASITELAQYLPELARVFAGFVKFAVQNPLLAGALGIGATAAQGFIRGAVTEIVKGHIAGATVAATRIEAAHIAGGMKLGNVIKGAGALAAVAIAAALAKEQIDKAMGANTDAQRSTAGALASSASRRGDAKTKAAQIRALEDAIAKEREAQSGASGFTQDLLGGLATLVDSDAPNMRAQANARIDELQRALNQKRAELEAMKGAGAASTSAGAAVERRAVATIDPAGQRNVGRAVADALYRQPLRVRVENLPAPGRSGGSAGSRGPTVMPPPASGGGY